MIIPYKIGAFITGMNFIPDPPERESETITMGGTSTDEIERPFYTDEEWKKRKGNV